MRHSANEISVAICDRLGIQRKGQTTGQICVRCLSPSHIDKNPSFSISLDKAIGKCWSCGFTVSLIKYYKERFGRSIYEDIGAQRPISLAPKMFVAPDYSILPETNFSFSGKFLPMDATDLSCKWMLKRGFTAELLGKLGIKYIESGKAVKASDRANESEWRYYSRMAFIPIYEKGNMLCFEARQLRDEAEWRNNLKLAKEGESEKVYKKVLYPKYGSTKTLWMIDRLDKDKPLYVTEGLMDAISLRTNNELRNSTCTFGRAIKDRQFYLLGRFRKVVFIPNNDSQGILAMEQLKKNKTENAFILPLPMGVNDVNDILQGKTRFLSLDALLNTGWLDRVKAADDFDIEAHMKKLG